MVSVASSNVLQVVKTRICAVLPSVLELQLPGYRATRECAGAWVEKGNRLHRRCGLVGGAAGRRIRNSPGGRHRRTGWCWVPSDRQYPRVSEGVGSPSGRQSGKSSPVLSRKSVCGRGQRVTPAMVAGEGEAAPFQPLVPVSFPTTPFRRAGRR